MARQEEEYVLIRLRKYVEGQSPKTFRDYRTGFRTEAMGAHQPGKWNKIVIPPSGPKRQKVIDDVEHLRSLRVNGERDDSAINRGQMLDPMFDIVGSQEEAAALEERERRAVERRAARTQSAGTASDPVSFEDSVRHVAGRGASARRRSFLGQNELGPQQKPYDRELLPSDTDATTPRDLESTRQPNPRDVTIPEDTESARRFDARQEVAKETQESLSRRETRNPREEREEALSQKDDDARALDNLRDDGGPHPVLDGTARIEKKEEVRPTGGKGGKNTKG